MSDPKHHDDRDELDLDAETVRDLEPRPEEAEDVQGGFGNLTLFYEKTCLACMGTNACTIKAG